MHNNAQMQRENIQVTQPCSAPSSSPSSPLASPGALSTTFCMPSSGNSCPIINTGDPNWQATKSTVRERNAAMFNNELMADISFIVGSDGKSYNCCCFPDRSEKGTQVNCKLVRKRIVLSKTFFLLLSLATVDRIIYAQNLQQTSLFSICYGMISIWERHIQL